MRKFLLITLSIIAVAFTASAARGDVNGDSEVNIADVNAVIDIILNSGDDSNGDVNSDGEVNIADVNAIIDIILNGGDDEELTPKEIALDFSELDEPAETITEDEEAPDYGDYVENTTWSTTVRINFDGDTATVTGTTSSIFATIDGAHVTITSAAKRVRYIVTGTTANGSIKFYSERKFQLQLNGADSTTSAASHSTSSSTRVLTTPCGTEKPTPWSRTRTRREPSSARDRFWSAARDSSTSTAWAAIAWPATTMCLSGQAPSCT